MIRILPILLALTGCSLDGFTKDIAMTTLRTPDGDVVGTVTFTESLGGTRVHASLAALQPNGEHPLRVHEATTCADFESGEMGAIYPSTAETAGDLGVIEVASNGRGKALLNREDLHVDGGAADVVGRVAVLYEHRAPGDDHSVAGDAPMACGEITGVQTAL